MRHLDEDFTLFDDILEGLEDDLRIIAVEALVWGNEIARRAGGARRMWRCPSEPAITGRQLFASAAHYRAEETDLLRQDDKLVVSKMTGGGADKSARPLSCVFSIRDNSQYKFGGLQLDDPAVVLGRENGSDAELVLFMLGADAEEFEAPRLVGMPNEGWLVWGRRLGGNRGGGLSAIAIFALRDRGHTIRLDASLVEAVEGVERQRSTERKVLGNPGPVSAENSRRPRLRDAFSFPVALYLKSLEKIGGLERWVIDNCARLTELGIDCYIYCLEGKAAPFAVPDQFQHKIRMFSGDDSELSRALALDKIKVLVINHVYEGIESVNNRICIIEILHNIYFWQRENDLVKSARERICRFVAISDSVFRYANEMLNIPRRNIELIEHGLDHRGLFRIGDDRRGSADTKFRIVCAANIYPQKNTIALIRAFDTAFGGRDDAVLELAGSPGHDDFTLAARECSASIGCADRIIWHGMLDRRSLSRIYNRASLFCMPSLYEGFGLSSLEAVYFGVPLLLSNTGHGPQLAAHGNGMVADIALSFPSLNDASALKTAFDPAPAHIEILANQMKSMRENYKQFKDQAMVLRESGSIRSAAEAAMAYCSLFQRLS